MPDQTYLQQAQPSTFGHYLLSFAYPAVRDARRLLDEFDWVNAARRRRLRQRHPAAGRPGPIARRSASTA